MHRVFRSRVGDRAANRKRLLFLSNGPDMRVSPLHPISVIARGVLVPRGPHGTADGGRGGIEPQPIDLGMGPGLCRGDALGKAGAMRSLLVGTATDHIGAEIAR